MKLTDRPHHIRHSCQGQGCFLDLHAPNWGVLDGVLPRGIRPSDLDGVIEMNGRFLWLEYKGPGAALPRGQRLMYEALALTPKHTVMVISASALPDMAAALLGEAQEVQGIVEVKRGVRPWVCCTGPIEATLRDLVSAWGKGCESFGYYLRAECDGAATPW